MGYVRRPGSGYWLEESPSSISFLIHVKPQWLAVPAMFLMAAVSLFSIAFWPWAFSSSASFSLAADRQSPVGATRVLMIIAAILFSLFFGFIGLQGVYGLLWSLTGRVTATFTSDGLLLETRILRWARATKYARDRIHRMRIEMPPAWQWRDGDTGPGMLPADVIAFDYDGRTVSFGGGIGTVDARRILAALALRYPDIVDEDIVRYARRIAADKGTLS